MARKRKTVIDATAPSEHAEVTYSDEFFEIRCFLNSISQELRKLNFYDEVTLVFQVLEPGARSLEAICIRIDVRSSDFTSPV